MDLASRPCTPHREDMTPLTRREVFDLISEVPEWSLKEGHLVRRFTLRNFRECLEMADDIGKMADIEGHYPDICISESRHVDVSWYSYFCGGLTTNDFIMAARLGVRVSSRQGGAL